MISILVAAVTATGTPMRSPLDIIHVGGDNVGIIHVGDELMFLGSGLDLRANPSVSMPGEDGIIYVGGEVGVIHVGEGVIYVGEDSGVSLKDMHIKEGIIYVGENEIKLVGEIHVGMKRGTSLRGGDNGVVEAVHVHGSPQ